METEPRLPAFRLAAIDLDGTLLGPDHRISEANARAITRLQQAGVEVTLASGRHYDMMKPFGAALPDVRWIVSVQGAEASSLDRQKVLHRSFLSRTSVAQVMELTQRLGFPLLAYTFERIYAFDPRAQDGYEEYFGYRPVLAESSRISQLDVFKLVWVGQPEKLAALSGVPELAQLPVQTVRSHQHLFEFVQPGVNKSTGVAAIAAHVGATAQTTIAFGDAENDLPLFHWAGYSVAMPHGWESVRRQATMIAPEGPPESAFARAVEVILDGR